LIEKGDPHQAGEALVALEDAMSRAWDGVLPEHAAKVLVHLRSLGFDIVRVPGGPDEAPAGPR
jgi:hypothetical protein